MNIVLCALANINGRFVIDFVRTILRLGAMFFESVRPPPQCLDNFKYSTLHFSTRIC